MRGFFYMVFGRLSGATAFSTCLLLKGINKSWFLDESWFKEGSRRRVRGEGGQGGSGNRVR